MALKARAQNSSIKSAFSWWNVVFASEIILLAMSIKSARKTILFCLKFLMNFIKSDSWNTKYASKATMPFSVKNVKKVLCAWLIWTSILPGKYFVISIILNSPEPIPNKGHSNHV